VIVPDINLLIYSYHRRAPQHERAKRWWERSLNGTELIGLPHEIMLGFVRIATNPRLGPAAVSLEKAEGVVSVWLKSPSVRILTPRQTHTQDVLQLMRSSQSVGPLASDASLAVYAIQQRAVLCTNDSDFGRFEGLEWTNPLT
jgi:toxin-antitoxin system PIN domain toxin